MHHVWIVEMCVKGQWQPTAGCGLTKKDAVMRMKDYWKPNNPNDKFRVQKYPRYKSVRR
ncbi:MAG: hypothetical protein GY774_35430 [Planctomycetes bacterium]|nr:hypothetical protein [Planctomycetota bacterium]